MFQVVEAVVAVAVVAELSVRKAVAISVEKAHFYFIMQKFRSKQERNHSGTHSLRHCDLVQLQGFLGLGAVSVVDVLEGNKNRVKTRKFVYTRHPTSRKIDNIVPIKGHSGL